jgi:hypothetical protein
MMVLMMMMMMMIMKVMMIVMMMIVIMMIVIMMIVMILIRGWKDVIIMMIYAILCYATVPVMPTSAMSVFTSCA